MSEIICSCQKVTAVGYFQTMHEEKNKISKNRCKNGGKKKKEKMAPTSSKALVVCYLLWLLHWNISKCLIMMHKNVCLSICTAVAPLFSFRFQSNFQELLESYQERS